MLRMLKTVYILLKVLMLTRATIAISSEDPVDEDIISTLYGHFMYPLYELFFVQNYSDNVRNEIEGGPSEPTFLRAFVEFENRLHKTDIFIRFRWKKPNFTNGVIQNYTARYWFFKSQMKYLHILHNISSTIFQIPIQNARPDSMYYFQIQAHNEVGPGPYTKPINISILYEKPLPLLLISSQRGIKVLDMDLQTNIAFYTYKYRSIEVIYSALERKIYWINEMWELISSDLDTRTYYTKMDNNIKITDLDPSAHNLCIDWIARNLYWIQSSNQTRNIMKLDLTLWQQFGIAKYDSILQINELKFLNVLPSIGYLHWMELNTNNQYVIMHSNLDGKNMKTYSKNEYDKCFCPYKLLEASSMQIDSTNISKPLIYWTSKNRLIAADIYGCSCNLILSAGNQTFFNYLTIDKTNIYLLSNSSEEPIYILKKEYALLESKEDAFTRVQKVPIFLPYINKVIALDRSLQAYPQTICLKPKKEDYRVKVVTITANSIVVNLPEPIPNSGCEKYHLATTVYNISVSHCLDLNEIKEFNVQTYERHYEIQNLTPFTEYTLKLALSNFYYNKLPFYLPFGTDMILRTNPGKLNAPKNVTVQFLTPTLAEVYWLPPKNLNCVAVTYEVHWIPVLVPNGTQNITYQMPRQEQLVNNLTINKLEHTGDGKFFTKIQLLPGQEYLVYVRVYPANFSDFFTDSVNKSVSGFREWGESIAVVDLTESIEISAMQYYLPLILGFVVALVIYVSYFYCSYRQCKETNEQVLPSIMADVELATLYEMPYRNIQRNALYTSGLQNKPDEFALTIIKRKQIILSKPLGSGAFGKVFQGTVKNIEGFNTMSVAIKMLRKNASSQKKMEFLQEAKLMNHFRHKHVLRLLGICLDADSPLIILELMDAGDLLKYLRESRTLQPSDSHALCLQDLLAMCEDVARGCCYLEKMHFVHRDLACRNCLISARNRENRIVKIGDFGLARDIYEDDYYKMKGEGPLPIRWMAPESLEYRKYTSKSDVWAFGVLMWEITSLGEHPYAAKNNSEVLQYVCEGGKLSKPLNCPSTLYQLMQHCWKVANDRPNFIHCLENIVTLRDNVEDAILSSANIIRHAELPPSRQIEDIVESTANVSANV